MNEELQTEITQEVSSQEATSAQPLESAMPAPQLGTLLIEARERCDLSAADLARQLRLGLRQVLALEENRFEDLPGNTFVRGFIRNYARAVNVDAAPLLSAYEQSRPQQPQVEMTRPSEGIAFPSKGTPKWVWYLGGVVLLLVLSPVVIYLLLQDDGSTPTPRKKTTVVTPNATAPTAIPHVPMELPMPQAVPQNTVPESPANTPLPVASSNPVLTPPAAVLPATSPAPAQTPNAARDMPSTPPASTAKAAPPAAASVTTTPASVAPAQETGKAQKKPGFSQVSLRFEGDAWVEIRDKTGAVVFSRLNRRGEVQLAEGKPPFNVVVGNAAQVRITYNDKPFDLTPHTKVNVARFKLE